MISAKLAKKNVKEFRENQINEFDMKKVLNKLSQIIEASSKCGETFVKVNLIDCLCMDSSQSANEVLINNLIEKIGNSGYMVHRHKIDLTISWVGA